MIYDITDINSLPAVAKDLIQKYGHQNIWAFKGEMGMGKTTLIKQICSNVGVKNHLSSPTFSIVNEYSSDIGTIYHFDFYRLETTEQAFEIGAEDYFFSNSYCFIEWPEKAINLIPSDALHIEIEILGPEHRRIFIP